MLDGSALLGRWVAGEGCNTSNRIDSAMVYVYPRRV